MPPAEPLALAPAPVALPARAGEGNAREPALEPSRPGDASYGERAPAFRGEASYGERAAALLLLVPVPVRASDLSLGREGDNLRSRSRTLPGVWSPGEARAGLPCASSHAPPELSVPAVSDASSARPRVPVPPVSTLRRAPPAAEDSSPSRGSGGTRGLGCSRARASLKTMLGEATGDGELLRNGEDAALPRSKWSCCLWPIVHMRTSGWSTRW